MTRASLSLASLPFDFSFADHCPVPLRSTLRWQGHRPCRHCQGGPKGSNIQEPQAAGRQHPRRRASQPQPQIILLRLLIQAHITLCCRCCRRGRWCSRVGVGGKPASRIGRTSQGGEEEGAREEDLVGQGVDGKHGQVRQQAQGRAQGQGSQEEGEPSHDFPFVASRTRPTDHRSSIDCSSTLPPFPSRPRRLPRSTFSRPLSATLRRRSAHEPRDTMPRCSTSGRLFDTRARGRLRRGVDEEEGEVGHRGAGVEEEGEGGSREATLSAAGLCWDDNAPFVAAEVPASSLHSLVRSADCRKSRSEDCRSREKRVVGLVRRLSRSSSPALSHLSAIFHARISPKKMVQPLPSAPLVDICASAKLQPPLTYRSTGPPLLLLLPPLS